MGGLCVKRAEPTPAVYHTIVTQHEGRCRWLKDDKLLRELEGDSVDSEILDEELRSIELREPNTWRGRMLKVLESTPLQIAMCVLVLLDAGVVVAEILLDMHVTRSQHRQFEADNVIALSLLRDLFPDQLTAFDGDNLPSAVGFLADFRRHGYEELPKLFNMTSFPDHPDGIVIKDDSFSEERTCRRLADICGKRFDAIGVPKASKVLVMDSNYGVAHETESTSGTTLGPKTTATPRQPRFAKIRRRRKPRRSSRSSTISPGSGAEALHVTSSDVDDAGNERAVGVHRRRVNSRKIRSVRDVFNFRSSDDRDVDIVVADGKVGDDVSAASVDISNQLEHVEESTTSSPSDVVPRHRINANNQGRTKLNDSDLADDELAAKIEHGLHYGSMVVLGVFVVQMLAKVVAMGFEFFRKKMEIFDAIIIIASFVLDMLFVGGSAGPDGEQAVAIIMVFLLWRILRIVNGLMLATKNRYEFRVRLQKRARMRLEKKLETIREDLEYQMKESNNLRTLCKDKGATEDELKVCKPRRRTMIKMNATSGLSSIASLSLGLSMSMSVDSNSASTSALKDRLDAALIGTRSPHPTEALNDGGHGVFQSAAARIRRCSLFVSTTTPGTTLAALSGTPSTPTSAPASFGGVRGPHLLQGCGKSFGSSVGRGCNSCSSNSSIGDGVSRPPMRRQSALCLTSADFVADLRTAIDVRNADGNDGDSGRTLGAEFSTHKGTTSGPGRLFGLSPVDERADTISAVVNMVDTSDDEVALERRIETQSPIEIEVGAGDIRLPTEGDVEESMDEAINDRVVSQ